MLIDIFVPFQAVKSRFNLIVAYPTFDLPIYWALKTIFDRYIAHSYPFSSISLSLCFLSFFQEKYLHAFKPKI